MDGIALRMLGLDLGIRGKFVNNCFCGMSGLEGGRGCSCASRVNESCRICC